MFVKVKDHQTVQALHFYKVERQTTLCITSNLSHEIPKLQSSWLSQSKLTSMNSAKDAFLGSSQHVRCRSEHRPTYQYNMLLAKMRIALSY